MVDYVDQGSVADLKLEYDNAIFHHGGDAAAITLIPF